ncbi:hypothetical protein HMPREF0281_00895 [Corynebacterium ammoniagenes DSM 20306]|uniref:Uncharacterized protein n=1 Tax=Corynebacterium ammoniagenes DSM 20306 TaxID=649754 RepID=A0ABP2IGW0_CORAM|nr:hypothetical protein HMPREF0281_00895 [Corynebacterium ammoniagenes DSM 20306]
MAITNFNRVGSTLLSVHPQTVKPWQISDNEVYVVVGKGRGIQLLPGC